LKIASTIAVLAKKVLLASSLTGYARPQQSASGRIIKLTSFLINALLRIVTYIKIAVFSV